jgi:hypothetical protein
MRSSAGPTLTLAMKAHELKTTKGDKMKFTYYFDELELIKGYAVMAAGEADIEYRIAAAEPDVGIFDAWATDIDITSISIHSNKKDVPAFNVSQDHWLYALIYDALINSDHVQQSCEEDAAEDKGDY